MLKNTNTTEKHNIQNTDLADVILSEKEKFWLERLKEYSKRHNDKEITSWWLRIEYESDIKPLNTTQINYILSKLATKGLLNKTTFYGGTRFSFSDNIYTEK